MPSYSFANYADRVVGLRLSLTAAGLQAIRFKRNKVAGVFAPDAAVPEALVPATQPFSFTLAVPQANQAGLLGVEAAGWDGHIYLTSMAFSLGTQDAFSGNGAETNAAPNAPLPGGPIMAARSIGFDFVPAVGGLGSQLHWKSAGASGVYTFDQANPGYIVALRLSAATSGQLALTTANPWGAAATIGWP